jgi:ABC-type polysaccharide/polyol phosphate export permease
VVGFLLLYQHVPDAAELIWFPVVVVVQVVFTSALALVLAALTVHFRDLRDILANVLTLWFFGTPIIYALSQVPPQVRQILNLNPMTHLVVCYQEVLFTPGPFTRWLQLLAVGAGSLGVFMVGFFVFDRLRIPLPKRSE